MRGVAAQVAARGRTWPQVVAGPGSNVAVLTVSYDDTAGRVLLAVVGAADSTEAHFQRSTDQVTWTDVRGGQAVTVSRGVAQLYDYEFGAGVLNYYRVVFDGDATVTTSITPDQTGVWLKNPTRPFLNRKVTVIDFTDVTRESRSGLFDVIGRTLAIGRTDLMSGRSTTVTMRVTDQSDADDLDGLIAVGEVLFLQPPGASALPTMYAVPFGYGRQRVAQTSSVRRFPLPLTECVMPDLSLAAVQSTWQTVINAYSTWADLIAAKATWNDVLQLVGSAEDVITS
jgi:hypothetical protein